VEFGIDGYIIGNCGVPSWNNKQVDVNGEKFSLERVQAICFSHTLPTRFQNIISFCELLTSLLKYQNVMQFNLKDISLQFQRKSEAKRAR
jgi:hypothetical protein